MPQKRKPVNPNNPYHLTARCINKEWFDIPMPEVWKLMCENLWYIKYIYGVKLHSFILMVNHYHLIATSPENNFSEAMHFFMGETARKLRSNGSRINRVWGGPHYRTEIQSENYFRSVYKYVYRNPVKAGICSRVEDYPYSSLQNIINHKLANLPLEYDHLLYDDNTATLNWLNTEVETKDWQSVKFALRKPIFKIAKNPATNKEWSNFRI